jgi:hypothetical protein
MMINKKIVLAVAAGLVISGPGCRKFMNVNTNPNVSQTATVQTLLPAAQLWVGSAAGTDLQIIGSIWSQYWTQTPVASQYINIEQYAPGQDVFSYAWTDLYAGAENFYQLYKLADTQNKKQYKAIALLMQAYTFQTITDGWGDVPYRQALQGQFTNGHLVNPKYDSQMVVYNGILSKIDSANKLINTADGVRPSTDDLIYGGDMNKWRKFANTLKLRILLRMAYIDPVGAQTKIAAFYNSVPKPVFIGEGDDAKIAYGFSSANKNPLYAEESSTQLSGIQNLGGSKTCIDSMNSNNDPRITIFYEAGSGGFIGIPQSAYNVSLPGGSYSIPNVYVAGDANNSASANAPVNLLTSWESFFLQAEVQARGWAATGYGDDSLFYWGIRANFNYYATALNNEYGPTGYTDYVTGGGYWTVYPTGGSLAARLRYIITQKWFAMCGNQGFEAYTELRRTGYPDFLVHPVNSLIGNQRPRRFLYPTTESSANANFPATGVAPLTSNVWWNVASIMW